jgi:hypothetical protein
LLGFLLVATLPTPTDLQKAVAKVDKSIKDRTLSSEWPQEADMRTHFLLSPAQVEVMYSGHKKVVLDSDFGTGKTWLLKSRALLLADSLKEKGEEEAQVFFVCLASARTLVKRHALKRYFFSHTHNLFFISVVWKRKEKMWTEADTPVLNLFGAGDVLNTTALLCSVYLYKVTIFHCTMMANF